MPVKSFASSDEQKVDKLHGLNLVFIGSLFTQFEPVLFVLMCINCLQKQTEKLIRWYVDFCLLT